MDNFHREELAHELLPLGDQDLLVVLVMSHIVAPVVRGFGHQNANKKALKNLSFIQNYNNVTVNTKFLLRG